ncbi:TPA: hypothetical protein RNS96_000267 [Stenotrophomonas maltophilia]|uniref:hypothetical protein n=1 Tax=Stenotrophomonas sp. STK17_22 TaxID=3455201 RepID=UPI0018D2F37C|nr:hypothetical protein [Stenotrophomonas maltophilia]HDX0879911.1 hypothetical protein [Stenotrophomonas maltophilia]
MLENELGLLIRELHRANCGDFDWFSEQDFPNFVAVGEVQCHFTSAALVSLTKLGRELHRNRDLPRKRIEQDDLIRMLRVVVAHAFFEGVLIAGEASVMRSTKKTLKERLEAEIDKRAGRVTHVFPIATTGFEKAGPLTMGPVELITVRQWIEQVHVNPDPNREELDPAWKQAVLGVGAQVLNRRSEEISETVRYALGNSGAVLRVTVDGFETAFSRKFGRIVAQCCLDILSLLHRVPAVFKKQGIFDWNSRPLYAPFFYEMDGFLGIDSEPNLPYRLTSSQIVSLRRCFNDFQGSIDKVVFGLLNQGVVRNPKLCQRWSTALNWYAEGCREPDDAVAVAKIGTALDVLSGGGEEHGILNMLLVLLEKQEDQSVIEGYGESLTLKVVVFRLYKQTGRSGVLHGTHVDRTKSFDELRQIGEIIAGRALLESLRRLGSYEGADEDRAFRTMVAR